MKNFKTSKCELLFVLTQKDVNGAKLKHLYSTWLQFIVDGVDVEVRRLPQGDWQLLGPLSTISEDLAKELVDECTANHYPSTSKWYMSYADRMCHQTAWLALQNIATHLGMNTNDNIYLLKKL